MGGLMVTIATNSIKSAMKTEVKIALHGTASAALEAINDHPGKYIEDTNGEIRKGTYEIAKEGFFFDIIKERTGMELTLFHGDTRVQTTILDDAGERVVGTQADQEIIDHVINQDEDYFVEEVMIAGKAYYGYYMPIHQDGSGEVVGMMFVGMDRSVQNATVNGLIQRLIITVLIAIVCFGAFAVIMAASMFKALNASIEAVRQVSSGNLLVEVDDRALKRGDEIGVLSRSVSGLKDELRYMFLDISGHANALLASAEQLDDTAKKNISTVDSVERAVSEIAVGATSQAEDTQQASESVYQMGEMIQETTREVANLNATADVMRQSSTQASKSLMELRSINDEVKEAIDLIYEQTNRTNASSQKIREATKLISSIAEETNLLSLNASIEAARAGEQGRSFAVVANQIQKLADQSNASTAAIDAIIGELLQDSAEAVDTMGKVREIIESQSQNVENTGAIVNQVMEGIEDSIRGIETIGEKTQSLNDARSAIVEVVQGLSAIAEENAASTEETSAATVEVANSFNEVTESAGAVKGVADEIVNTMSNFKIE